MPWAAQISEPQTAVICLLVLNLALVPPCCNVLLCAAVICCQSLQTTLCRLLGGHDADWRLSRTWRVAHLRNLELCTEPEIWRNRIREINSEDKLGAEKYALDALII